MRCGISQRSEVFARLASRLAMKFVDDDDDDDDLQGKRVVRI